MRERTGHTSIGLAGVVRALALALMLAGVACGADGATTNESLGTTSEAITNASVDDNDGAVVSLLLQGQPYCSGVVVASYVVITAAHCLLPTPPDQVFFGTNPGEPGGMRIGVSDALAHPDFDADTLDNDVGIVGLASASPVAPVPIHKATFDASFVDAPIRIVGFGLTGPAASRQIKHSGASSIVSYDATTFVMKSTPSQTCSGDSGGPAFATIGGKELLVGLTSSGDSACQTYGRDMRVDPYVSFFEQYAVAYRIPASTEKSGVGCMMGVPRDRTSASAMFVCVLGLVVARARRRLRRG